MFEKCEVLLIYEHPICGKGKVQPGWTNVPLIDTCYHNKKERKKIVCLQIIKMEIKLICMQFIFSHKLNLEHYFDE